MKIHASVCGAIALAGCLGPLGGEQPTASVNILPAGADVPSVTTNNDLTSQVRANDGLPDTSTLVPLLGGGVSDGKPVSYWSFGPMSTAPSPIYLLVDANNTRIDHPPLVDALPGDPAYSAVHNVFFVQITSKYRGERLTTSQALADAVELGLVMPPVSQGRNLASPIVLPGTKVQVSADLAASKDPDLVYGHGVAAGIIFFGGTAGNQPGAAIQGTARVSFLREQGSAAGGGVYDHTRPIFQATIPPEAGTTNLPPAGAPDYLPLALEIDVDLINGNAPSSITSDADLFTTPGNLPPFTPPSTIGTVSDKVATFNVTPNVLFLQQQFVPGAL